MRVRVVSLVILSLFSTSFIQAQERCGTVPLMQHLAEQKGIKQNTEQFEEWLQTKIQQRKQQLQAQRTHEGPYQIPVVVHVIHNDEPYGTGINILDDRIFSQIEVLNDDFRRENADANNTPSEFSPIAGSMDIEFILAKQDPDGQPTDGIIRKDGGKASWSPFDEELHAVSYWPSEDYLNIWVTNIGSGFVGYAQFPFSTLPGLDGEAEDVAETDGVVIDYTVFGVGSEDPDYNLGRTITHEVGHFLGLRHIWGDANDCATDYVADTPPQEEETYGCEGLNHPEADACTSMKMFQNYMDYTDDACMNLFTADQVDRMITILESVDIPRRNSLLTSPGLEEPIPGTIDLQILDVISPGPVTCNNPAELRLTVENLSEELITELKVRIAVNGSAQQTITLSAGLSFTGITELSIPTSTLMIGENLISVNIFLINGATDPEPDNNKLDIGVKLIYEECAPFSIYPNENGETLITFDLPEENTVSMSIINTMGQLVTSATIPEVLNQTFILPTTIPDHTVYIVRLRIGSKFYSRKVYFHR